MTYIKPEQLKKIKALDLLTYLQNYEPERLEKISKTTWCLKDHDSLHISNGLWNWFSRSGVGGRSALDFLIKVDGYKFIDAAQLINDRMKGMDVSIPDKVYEEKRKKLDIPMRAPNDQKLTDYLMSRGISKNIINYCIQNFLIYQHDNGNYSNVCFIGYNRKIKLPRQITMRGIESTFVGEASGSDKAYSFCIEPENKDCDTVHVFEGAIDALSYATLYEKDGKKFNKEYLLSINGVTIPKVGNEIKLPIALTQFLDDHELIRHVTLHLDTDKIGLRASHLICQKINETTILHCTEEPPKYGKDVNDSLCISLGLKPTPTRTKLSVLEK